jgi:hypothetical protein
MQQKILEMKMQTWTVKNEESLNFLIDALKEQKKPFVVELLPAHRTIPQNRLFYLIYDIIAEQLYGGDGHHARNECKLTIGVPILRRDSEKFQQTYDRLLKPASYEDKLAMMEYVSISSIFDKAQGTEYIKSMFDKYAQKGVTWSEIIIAQVGML